MALNYQHAVAGVAAALNNVDQTVIGDPRKKEYKVAVQFSQLKDAFEFVRQLARLGIIPKTTIVHDEMLGEPVGAYVNIYGKEDQRRLLETPGLAERQRDKLETLVLARGPIPDDILEKIWVSAHHRRKPDQIAARMNELGIIAGMGGVRWTRKKVKDALVLYEERNGIAHEAA